MEENKGLHLKFNSPHVCVEEVVGPDMIEITLAVTDYKGFIDSLLGIDKGREKSFIKSGPNRRVIVKIKNEDGGIKTL